MLEKPGVSKASVSSLQWALCPCELSFVVSLSSVSMARVWVGGTNIGKPSFTDNGVRGMLVIYRLTGMHLMLKSSYNSALNYTPYE